MCAASGWFVGFCPQPPDRPCLDFLPGLHLIVLNKLTEGTKAYDDFVAFVQLPLIKVGELTLIAAVVLHGLNAVYYPQVG